MTSDLFIYLSPDLYRRFLIKEKYIHDKLFNPYIMPQVKNYLTFNKNKYDFYIRFIKFIFI